MKVKILTFLKTHKKQAIVTGCVLLVLVCAFSIAVQARAIDLGIDILCKPGDYDGTVTAINADGYLWLTSDHAKYDVHDTIELTVHSAYYDSLEDAQKAEEAWVTIFHSEYFEIEIVGANDTVTDETDFGGELPEYNDYQTTGTFSQPDPEQLMIHPNSMTYAVSRESLTHSYTLKFRIKEDAPERFSDTLTISARSDIRATSKLWKGIGRTGIVFVTVERDGDTVKLYATRNSSLGKRNYW